MAVAVLALLIPIVAILAGTYQKVAKVNAETAQKLGRATSHLDDELARAQADRDRLRQRVEALEAIVTGEGFDLEMEARRAGISDGRIDPGLLEADPPATESTAPERRRVR